MTSSHRLRVCLLSGSTVYDGPRPHSLAELRRKVASFIGLRNKNELLFCSGDIILRNIKDAGEHVTVVRDQVMGLLEKFLRNVYSVVLPEHLRPAREHRGLMLAAVERNGLALRHASAELRSDRDVVLTAVASDGRALQYASAELQADQNVVTTAVTRCGHALQYASADLRGHRSIVLKAVRNIGWSLRFASVELRVDRDVVLKAAYNINWARQYVFVANKNVHPCLVLAAVASNDLVLRHTSEELGTDQDVLLEIVKKMQHECHAGF